MNKEIKKIADKAIISVEDLVTYIQELEIEVKRLQTKISNLETELEEKINK